MKLSTYYRQFIRPIRFLFLSIILTACGVAPTPTSAPIATTQSVAAVTPFSTTSVEATAIPDIWGTLLKATPFSFNLPLPDSVSTPIDGTYGKVDQSPPQWWTCLRCADYRPAGGIWKLQLDKGTMRIYYTITDWQSIASFTISNDELKIFNDPICPQDIGEYKWKMEKGSLSLTLIHDDCAFDLRGKNLNMQAWLACNENENSPACQELPSAPDGTTPAQSLVSVSVHGGDSHFFSTAPDLFAVPNSENVPAPQGIDIAYDNNSIGYGTYRVLWAQGTWVEAATELPYTHIGVQFWGPRLQGWARVLFDGVEVWRGHVSTLGSKFQYYGGYIEITGFKPGKHTIRVEGLSFDFRPIDVAAFGFSGHEVHK